MNIFGVIYRYLMLKKMTPAERKNVVPRVVIFAGSQSRSLLAVVRPVLTVHVFPP